MEMLVPWAEKKIERLKAPCFQHGSRQRNLEISHRLSSNQDSPDPKTDAALVDGNVKLEFAINMTK